VAVSTRDLAFWAMLAAVSCWAPSALALDPRYPDWPCQQLKVPGIAVASVWTGPSIEAIDTTKPRDARDAELIARLAARRTPIEEARKLIADYVTGTDAQKQEEAATLFAGLYSTLNAQRDEVMDGIERFSRKQKAAADDIREEARKLREIQDKPDADQAQIEELASRLAWQTRIFEDRRKSTSYVCDVPVLIEKRLFELGAAIQNVANDDSSRK
jgi:DNA repair ATPase RecN